VVVGSHHLCLAPLRSSGATLTSVDVALIEMTVGTLRPARGPVSHIGNFLSKFGLPLQPI
jgi:hypothetical protein